jgi:hypothetical protein
MAKLEIFKKLAYLWIGCEYPVIIYNNGDFTETETTYQVGTVTIPKEEKLRFEDLRAF